MYKNILHATDLRENHFSLCERAHSIAQQFNAKIYFLHVIEPPSTLQIAQGLGFAEMQKPIKDDAQAVLKIVGEALNIPVEQQFVEIGSIKMRILEQIKALDCDLLIIGSYHHSHLPTFIGSTAHALVNRAPCDVLTLR